MKKTALTLAILISLIGTTYAAAPKPGVPTTPGNPTNPTTTTPQLKTRTITGITMSPAHPSGSELVLFTVTSRGGANCYMQVKLLAPTYEGESEAMITDKPNGTNSSYFIPAGSAKLPFGMNGPGTYTATAHPHNSYSPKCEGEAQLTFVIPDPKVLNPNAPEAKAPGAKPNPLIPSASASNSSLKPAITGLSVPDVINPAKPYEIKLLGHGQCSFHVEYGDGVKEDLNKMLPFTFDHGYLISSGETKTFPLKANALGDKCTGFANADVIVAGPGIAPPPNNNALGATTGTAASANSNLKVACPPGKVC